MMHWQGSVQDKSSLGEERALLCRNIGDCLSLCGFVRGRKCNLPKE